jgi:gas vesicle protein
MKSFLFGLGVGVGLGVLFAPGRGEDTRRDLGERLNSVAEDDSDDSTALPPKKDQARETAQTATSSTERTSLG